MKSRRSNQTIANELVQALDDLSPDETNLLSAVGKKMTGPIAINKDTIG